MKTVVVASLLLASAPLFAAERNILECQATRIVSSPFEEAFSVEEYPEVTVSVDKDDEEKLSLQIGSNGAYVHGEDGVTIRDHGGARGFRYVVTLRDRSEITLTSIGNRGRIFSSHEDLEAQLKCQVMLPNGHARSPLRPGSRSQWRPKPPAPRRPIHMRGPGRSS